MIQETPRGELEARELYLDILLHMDSLRTSLVEDGSCTEWRHRMIDSVVQSADAMAIRANEREAEMQQMRTLLHCSRNAPLWFEHHTLNLAEAVAEELDRQAYKLKGSRREVEQLRTQYQVSLSSLEGELQEREDEVRRLNMLYEDERRQMNMQWERSSAETADMCTVMAQLQEENLVLEELFSKEHQAAAQR